MWWVTVCLGWGTHECVACTVWGMCVQVCLLLWLVNLLHLVCCLPALSPCLPSQLLSSHPLRFNSRVTSSRKPALASGGRGGRGGRLLGAAWFPAHRASCVPKALWHVHDSLHAGPRAWWDQARATVTPHLKHPVCLTYSSCSINFVGCIPALWTVYT